MSTDKLPILVIKVGTSTLLDRDEQPSDSFRCVAESIMSLRRRYDIILVTSGAIGFGVTRLNLGERPRELARLQALSMIGQVGLLKSWREALNGITVGQVLVTRHDLQREITADLFRQSIDAIWSYGGLPIVNENDAVSREEISFGDNDSLAAEVAVTMGAETLIFLTDQDGIQANYGTPNQCRLELVTSADAHRHLVPSKSYLGKGGATSKIQAACIALAKDVEVYVAHAGSERAVEDALIGKSGTKVIQ